MLRSSSSPDGILYVCELCPSPSDSLHICKLWRLKNLNEKTMNYIQQSDSPFRKLSSFVQKVSLSTGLGK